MIWVWAWSIGVFFCFFIYIILHVVSVSVSVSTAQLLLFLFACLHVAMERMGYHSIVIYIHVATCMDAQGVVDMDMDFIDTCIVCGTFSDCARTDGIFFLMLLAISFICEM